LRQQHARINVCSADADRPRPEEQDTGMGRVILKGVRRLVIIGAVHATPEIHGSLPREVVSLVVTSRDVDVVTFEASRAVTAEEQAAPIPRQPWCLLVGRRVDGGAQILRRPPGVVDTLPLRDVEVGPADIRRAIAAVKIETAPVPGDRCGLLDEGRVDWGAEVDGSGPGGE